MEKRNMKRREAQGIQKRQQELLKKALAEPSVSEIMKLLELSQGQISESNKLATMTRIHPEIHFTNGTSG